MFAGMSDAFVAARREPRGDRRPGRLVGPRLVEPARRRERTTAARGAVDVALTTADLVLGGEPVAYGLCRPPVTTPPRRWPAATASSTTPRSRPTRSSGATGERVAILDVDVHHGNGTQQIFWRRDDVWYASLHADPRRLYPFFLGHADEVG